MPQKISSRRFENWKKPKIEHLKMTKWGWIVSHPESLIMGENVDIGAFSYLNAYYGIRIEDNVQIGGGCKIYSLDTISGKNGLIVFKKGCKVGANSVVMGGVTIGENSIVAARAVVTKDVPANVVVAGNPAKIIKKLDPNIEPLTRQKLFESGMANPNHEHEGMQEMLKANSTLSWLKSVFLPDKNH